MRFNESSLQRVGAECSCDREGRLLYKSPRDSYKERWFKLKGNLLFYFRTNSKGEQQDRDVLGLQVLDGCQIQMEPISDRPFVFSIVFNGEDKPHYFSGQSLAHCQDWVTALQSAKILDLKSRFSSLQNRLWKLTGRDPTEKMIHIPSIYDPNKAVQILPKTKSETKPPLATTRSTLPAKFHVSIDSVSRPMQNNSGSEKNRHKSALNFSTTLPGPSQKTRATKGAESNQQLLVDTSNLLGCVTSSEFTDGVGNSDTSSYLQDLASLDHWAAPRSPPPAFNVDRLGHSRTKINHTVSSNPTKNVHHTQTGPRSEKNSTDTPQNWVQFD